MNDNQIQPVAGVELALPFTDDGQDVQQQVVFQNGYGVSIIRTQYSYGGARGLFEIAGLYDGELTDIEGILPSTVEGWLDVAGVLARMKQISDIPTLATAIEATAQQAIE